MYACVEYANQISLLNAFSADMFEIEQTNQCHHTKTMTLMLNTSNAIIFRWNHVIYGGAVCIYGSTCACDPGEDGSLCMYAQHGDHNCLSIHVSFPTLYRPVCGMRASHSELFLPALISAKS